MKDSPSNLPDNLRATYATLLNIADPDDLHDLIAGEGSKILERPVPYLAQRLRWRHLDRLRRDGRIVEAGESDRASALFFDPAERVSEMLEISEAFAALPREDVWLLWWAAAGYTTSEQIELWEQAEFVPASPSDSYLRKRLSLARKRLRSAVDEARTGD